MTLDGLAPIIIAALAGGGLSAWVSYLVNRRSARRDDFSAILEERKAEIEDLRKRFQEQEIEIALLKKKVAAVEVDRDDVPVPMWVVDMQGRYLSINARFVTEFLLPRGKAEADVIGKTHTEVWNADTAAKLHALDVAAMKSPERRARLDNIQLNGTNESVTIYKAPILKNRTLVGFTGLAIPHVV